MWRGAETSSWATDAQGTEMNNYGGRFSAETERKRKKAPKSEEEAPCCKRDALKAALGWPSCLLLSRSELQAMLVGSSDLLAATAIIWAASLLKWAPVSMMWVRQDRLG